ncbi:universal stress protein [Streptomyces sp. NPDC058739]|uniref:universal stress protein n=1 Tax=Streptomyces sp. NPDC058739 TaxID=3346618 RepID=UPI0036A485C1
MAPSVIVGLDGLRESRAAAEWAAREARLLGLPLRLVHVTEQVPEPLASVPLLGTETQRQWAERVPRETAEGLRLRHPGLDVTMEQLSGRPDEVLAKLAEDAELLVLGSRRLGEVGGFLLGSVGLAVVARAERPVVLVRAEQQAADEHTMDPAGIPSAAGPFRPVVLGLDTENPDARLIEFAFAAASRRRTALRVVHGWYPSPYYAYGLSVEPELHTALARQEGLALSEILRPWREKFPDVKAVRETHHGPVAVHLVDASHEASLVVVGRRARRGPVGARIGSVAHAVLHHAVAPVAVVPHD